MENELYSRQAELNLYLPHGVAIIGCGGIGSWVAIFAAMSGIKNLHLYDTDVMEESNRNRLPFCQGSIGQPKVEVVAGFIRAIRPEAFVYPINCKFEPDMMNVLSGSGIENFIDCTDSPKTQVSLYNESKKWDHYRYIRAGYDGTHITVTSHVSGWIKKDVEQEQYQVNPSWVVPAATVAALAIAKLMKFNNQEVGLDLSEIGIPVLDKQKRVTARCKQLAQERRTDEQET